MAWRLDLAPSCLSSIITQHPVSSSPFPSTAQNCCGSLWTLDPGVSSCGDAPKLLLPTPLSLEDSAWRSPLSGSFQASMTLRLCSEPWPFSYFLSETIVLDFYFLSFSVHYEFLVEGTRSLFSSSDAQRRAWPRGHSVKLTGEAGWCCRSLFLPQTIWPRWKIKL